MSRRIRRRFVLMSGSAALLFTAVPAFSQTSGAPSVSPTAAPESTTDEIVVTARKREERLQDVPISVTAVTQEQIEQNQIDSLDELTKLAPNLVIDAGLANDGNSSTSNIFIRGIGQLGHQANDEQGVGLYVDGVFLGRTAGSILEIVDIGRVEILRGPQGTLFGKNTIGGAVNVISANPTGDGSGEISLTGGSRERLDAKAKADVSLIDDLLAARAAVSYRSQDGWTCSQATNLCQGNVNRVAGRVKFGLTPADSFIAHLIVDYSNFDERSAGQQLIGLNNNGTLVGLYNAFLGPTRGFLTNAFVTPPRVNNSVSPNFSDVTTWGASLDFDWDIGEFATLTSISAYRDLENGAGVDGDNSPLDFYQLNQFDDQHQYSQELRLAGTLWDDRVKWLVGGYISDEKITSDLFIALADGLYNTLLPLGIPGLSGNRNLDIVIDQTYKLRNKTQAAFGQTTISITPELNLTAGIRFNRDIKTIAAQSRRRNAGTFVIDPNDPLANRRLSQSSTTPMVTLDYKPTPDALIYASFATGFKSGGFPNSVQASADLLPYDPERVKTYEIGFKTDWLGRRLRINGAAFFNDYTDLQLFFNADPGAVIRGVPCPVTQLLGCFRLGNVDAEIYGGELEISARPSDNFDLSLGVGYLHNKLTKAELGTNPNITTANELPKTPKWSVNLGAGYRIPVSDAGTLELRGSGRYRSGVFIDYENSPEIVSDDYLILDATVSFTTADDLWTATAGVSNLTKETYITSGNSILSTGGFAQVGYNEPRAWFVSLTRRW